MATAAEATDSTTVVRVPNQRSLLLRKRPLLAASLTLLTLGIGLSPASAQADDASASIVSPAGPDGVEVFTMDTPSGDARSAKAVQALYAAEQRAEAKPAEFAPPYLDRSNGAVVAPVVTSSGAATTAAEDVPRAANSKALLAGIQDEAIGLTNAQIPGADAIYASRIQADHNRVVVQVRSVTPQLRAELARRYGSDRIAIQLTPGARPLQPAYGGRQNDTSPFLGGASFDASESSAVCSTAFAWRIPGGYHGMLTAGHCMPNGGGAWSSGNQFMGYSISNNWNDGVGTVRYPNDPYDRGDLSLIQVPAGQAASVARVYVYGVNSSDWRNVTARWNRKSYYGDKFCTSGARTGEQCNWTVQNASMSLRYDSGEIIRNVTEGYRRTGICTDHGDSGGAVYTVDGAGQVWAKGVYSGGTLGGSDDCYVYFTEITDAVNALPGDIATL
ncbi:S1 family peptidase [Streptomyces sp. NPDC059524]